MKMFLSRSLCLVCFLFALNLGQAQPVITEYFLIKESLKIDLMDKKVQKTVCINGILDIGWKASESLLAITYDPKMADSREVLKAIHEVIDLNNAGASAPKAAHTK